MLGRNVPLRDVEKQVIPEGSASFRPVQIGGGGCTTAVRSATAAGAKRCCWLSAPGGLETSRGWITLLFLAC